jgi:hypothetical protein
MLMHSEAMAAREKTFNIRFSSEEWERIEKLCAFHGINAAALIRMALKKEERLVDAMDPGGAPTDEGRKVAHKSGKRARK